MKITTRKSPPRGRAILASMRARTAALLAVVVAMLAASVFALQSVGAAQAQTAQQQTTTIQIHPQDTTAIRLETFVVSNNSVYYKYSDNDGGNWLAWTNLGNPVSGFQITEPVSVVTDGANRHLQIFVMGQDPFQRLSVYTKVIDPSNCPTGNFGKMLLQASRPVVEVQVSQILNPSFPDQCSPAGDLDAWMSSLSWVTVNTRLWRTTGWTMASGRNTGRFWERVPCRETRQPFPGDQASSMCLCAAEAMSWSISGLVMGAGLLVGKMTGGSGVDSNSIISGPAAANTGPNSTHVFALGPNGDLLHRRSSNGAWTNWEDLGTPLGSALSLDPAAVVWHPIIPTPPPTPTPRPPTPTPRPQPIPTRVVCRQPLCRSTP